MVQSTNGPNHSPYAMSSVKQVTSQDFKITYTVSNFIRNNTAIRNLRNMAAQYKTGLQTRVIVSSKEAPQLVAIINKVNVLMKETVFHALMKNINEIEELGESQEIQARFLGCVATLKNLIEFGTSGNMSLQKALKEEVQALKTEMPQQNQNYISVLDALVNQCCSKTLAQLKEAKATLLETCNTFYQQPTDFCKKMCTGEEATLNANITSNVNQLFAPSQSPPPPYYEEISDSDYKKTPDPYYEEIPNTVPSSSSDYVDATTFNTPHTRSTENQYVTFNPVSLPFKVSQEAYNQIMTYIQEISAAEHEKALSQMEDIRKNILLQKLDSNDETNCLFVLDVLNKFNHLELPPDDQQRFKRICKLLTDSPKNLELVSKVLPTAQTLEQLNASALLNELENIFIPPPPSVLSAPFIEGIALSKKMQEVIFDCIQQLGQGTRTKQETEKILDLLRKESEEDSQKNLNKILDTVKALIPHLNESKDREWVKKICNNLTKEPEKLKQFYTLILNSESQTKIDLDELSRIFATPSTSDTTSPPPTNTHLPFEITQELQDTLVTYITQLGTAKEKLSQLKQLKNLDAFAQQDQVNEDCAQAILELREFVLQLSTTQPNLVQQVCRVIAQNPKKLENFYQLSQEIFTEDTAESLNKSIQLGTTFIAQNP